MIAFAVLSFMLKLLKCYSTYQYYKTQGFRFNEKQGDSLTRDLRFADVITKTGNLTYTEDVSKLFDGEVPPHYRLVFHVNSDAIYQFL